MLEVRTRASAIDAEKRPLKFQIAALKAVNEKRKKIANPEDFGV